MGFIDRIVEERIQRAQEEGAFENLPGKGEPLNCADDAHVPEDLRLVYKVLKNSNCLPPELELRKEIFNLRQILGTVTDLETRRKIIRELNYKLLKVNSSERDT